MIRRASLPTAAAYAGLGRRPPNAIRYEPGQRVGLCAIVRQLGSWAGVARWELRCSAGHLFARSSQQIRNGKVTCQECRQHGNEAR